MRRRQKDWRGVWACATVTALAGGFLALAPLGAPLWRTSYDLPLLNSAPANITNLVLVYLDDDSAQALGARPDGTLDRRWHAELLERLTADGAKVVVFDLVFGQADAADAGDHAFAAALRKHGRVILAAAQHVAAWTTAEQRRPLPPAEMFATNAFAVGSAAVELDADDVARRMSESRVSLAWVVLKAAEAIPPGLDDTAERERWLKHYLPRRAGGSAFVSVPFQTALASNGTPPGFFSGKTVFIAARRDVGPVVELRDRFATPFSRWDERYAPVPGVELHATAFANVVRGEWLSPLAPALVAFVNALLGIGGAVLLYPRRRGAATIIFLCAFTGIALAGCVAEMNFHFVFPWLIPAAVQLPIAFIWALGRNANLPGKPEVFLSYRRIEGEGSGYALGLYHALRARGVEVHWDVVSLDSGGWKEQLGRHIDEVPNFVLLVTRNSLNPERLRRDDDVLRWEMERAYNGGKTIIPILFDGAQIPSAGEPLPASLAWIRDPEVQPDVLTYREDDALRLADRVVPRLRRRNFALRWLVASRLFKRR